MLGQVPIASCFASSIIAAFPYRAEDLQSLLSARFTVDESNGSAYFAIAVVDQIQTRPQGFPAWLGIRMSLIEYLVFATYTSSSGQPLSGLVLVHSETDSRVAARLGSLVSPYRFDHVDLKRTIGPTDVVVKSDKAQLVINARRSHPEPDAIALLGDLAKPRSFNFVDDTGHNRVIVNRGILKGWRPVQLEVNQASSGWLDRLAVESTGPPLAMMVQDVRYLFKRHRIDPTP